MGREYLSVTKKRNRLLRRSQMKGEAYVISFDIIEDSFSKIRTFHPENMERKRYFSRSIDEKSEEKRFVFYDGPPFATGLPHYGHLVASTLKDIVPRYWTMRGYQVERRFGWDTHGLPIEMIVEQKLGLSGPTSSANLALVTSMRLVAPMF